jgi:hypothetical protein
VPPRSLNMKSWRNILFATLAAGSFILFAVFVSRMFHGFTRPYDFHSLCFDSAKWKAIQSELTHSSVRLRMADDFLNTQQPVGKSRAEIVGLLGEPDDTPYFRNFDMVYHLGLERNFMAIDSEWLVMSVNEKGVVTEARLMRD